VNRSAPGTLLRILPLTLAGVAAGVVLQLTEPRVRLYAAIAPALLAVILGLAGTAALIVRVVVKQRMATAVAATQAAAAAQAAQDRLRFLARLDHELKNPLTAMRAGLANVDQALGRLAAADGARTALTSVSGQADRHRRSSTPWPNIRRGFQARNASIYQIPASWQERELLL
jgi:two-component system, OmpR family, sensor kinase